MQTSDSNTEHEPYVPQAVHTPHSYQVDKNLNYNYNVKTGPKNKKLILLTLGHVAIMGCLYGDSRDDFILGWFPLPGQDKDAELHRKLELPVRVKKD